MLGTILIGYDLLHMQPGDIVQFQDLHLRVRSVTLPTIGG